MLSMSRFTAPPHHPPPFPQGQNRKEFGDLWLNWGQAFKVVLASWGLRFWPWMATWPPGTGFEVVFSKNKAALPYKPAGVNCREYDPVCATARSTDVAVPDQPASSEGELSLWWGWAPADSLQEHWSPALGDQPMPTSTVALLKMKQSCWSYQLSPFHEQ